MSLEHLHHQPEKQSERLGQEHEAEKSPDRKNETLEREPIQGHDIEVIRHSIKHEAISTQEATANKYGHSRPQSQLHASHELKDSTYQYTLHKVRKSLSLPERGFSLVVHQPAVDTISNAAAQTVTRPSGLLGGGIVSLIGSGVVLYLARYYGFRYNFFVFFVLFGSGYVIGMLAELLISRLTKHRRH